MDLSSGRPGKVFIRRSIKTNAQEYIDDFFFSRREMKRFNGESGSSGILAKRLIRNLLGRAFYTFSWIRQLALYI